MAAFISWWEVITGVPNHDLVYFVNYGRLSLFVFCVCGVCSVSFPCVWLSAIDYLKRLVFEMVFHVASETLNPTHSVDAHLVHRKQDANLLCDQANSASYPQNDGK